MRYKISVIVPVYNSEKFISRTLRRLIAQTFKNFEVIISDDGSSDSSLEIIKWFCCGHANFRYISHPHKGVSFARTSALKIAKGEYIAFVDSDDWVKSDFLEKLCEGIKQADICVCNYKRYFPGINLSITNFFHMKERIYNRKSAIENLVSDIFMRSYFCNKLFKKTLFKDIYIPDMCFEDQTVMIQLFNASNKISVIKNVLYYYTKRKKSMTGTMNEEKLEDYIRSFEFIRNFLNSNFQYKDISCDILRNKVIYASFKFFAGKYLFKGNFSLFFENMADVISRVWREQKEERNS